MAPRLFLNVLDTYQDEKSIWRNGRMDCAEMRNVEVEERTKGFKSKIMTQ
jgi:hypothetical protein